MFQNEEHVDDAVTLQDYRLLHPMTVELSSASIRDGYLLLPGEMDPMIIYRVPTRQCRLLMSSLLESLEINDLDRCASQHLTIPTWWSPRLVESS